MRFMYGSTTARSRSTTFSSGTYGMNGSLVCLTLGSGIDSALPMLSSLQKILEVHFAPVLGVAADEVLGIVARLDGRVDAQLSDRAPEGVLVERPRRRVVGRAAR